MPPPVMRAHPGGPPYPGAPADWREPAPWWMPEAARGKAVEWASYQQRSALAAGAQDQVTINFGNNQVFAILSTQLEARDQLDQSHVDNPNVLVQITDESGSVNLFNGSVHITTVFGTGQRPFWWQVTRMIAPGTTLSLNLQSLEPVGVSGAVDYDLYLTFSGFKIFGYAP